MDGHEWPYLVKGNTMPLEPGMTFSDEPGIYVVGELTVGGRQPFRYFLSEPEFVIPFDVIAHIGIIFLLFLVGIETSVDEMRQVGPNSSRVAIIGVLLSITIILLPFGRQCFKLANFALWPFGRVMVEISGKGGCLNTVGNIIWVVLAGIWLAIAHVFWALLLAISGFEARALLK